MQITFDVHPIETAPKNRPIMVFLGGKDLQMWIECQWSEACQVFAWATNEEGKVRRECFFDQPTHWAEVADMSVES